MEAKQLIKALPTEERTVPEGKPFIRVAEFFYDTIQGEGVYAGQPAAFLRLKGCTLNCKWCDTREVWRHGNPYTIQQLLLMMHSSDIVKKLDKGQHLVFTGGSPLLQQDKIVQLMDGFREWFSFLPFIEVENECTIKPTDEMLRLVHCWNNSPKLENSGNRKDLRYNPEAVYAMHNTGAEVWFKFVISKDNRDEQWKEIEEDFIDELDVHRSTIILMPEGATREELAENREAVVELAIREGVRYSTREHIVLWNKKTGI